MGRISFVISTQPGIETTPSLIRDELKTKFGTKVTLLPLLHLFRPLNGGGKGVPPQIHPPPYTPVLLRVDQESADKCFHR